MTRDPEIPRRDAGLLGARPLVVGVGLAVALGAIGLAAWLALREGPIAAPKPPGPSAVPALPVSPRGPHGKDEVATFTQILIGYRLSPTMVGKVKEPNPRSHQEAEALATRLIERLQAGEPMNALVLEFTDDRGEDGTPFNGATVTLARKASPALQVVKDAVFSLKPGELYATPIETGLALLIVRRDE